MKAFAQRHTALSTAECGQPSNRSRASQSVHVQFLICVIQPQPFTAHLFRKIRLPPRQSFFHGIGNPTICELGLTLSYSAKIGDFLHPWRHSLFTWIFIELRLWQLTHIYSFTRKRFCPQTPSRPPAISSTSCSSFPEPFKPITPILAPNSNEKS